jgi:hypothetical protein
MPCLVKGVEGMGARADPKGVVAAAAVGEDDDAGGTKEKVMTVPCLICLEVLVRRDVPRS